MDEPLSALCQNPADPQALFDAGRYLYDQGQYQASNRILEAAAGRRPDAVQIFLHLAQGYSACGRHLDAIDALHYAVALDPENAAYRTLLGHAYSGAHKLPEAEAAWTEALKLDPHNADALEALSLVLQGIGQYDRAEEFYQRLGRRSVHYEIAMPRIIPSVEWLKERREKAARVLEEMAADPEPVENPDHLMACPPFFLAYHGMNDVEMVRKYSEMLLKRCPALSYEAAHCQLGTRAVPITKPRIGLVSHYLRPKHPVGMCFRGIIRELAKDMDVTVIAPNAAPMEGAKALAMPDGLSRQQQAIAALELDALVYLDLGMNTETWFLAHSRLAPVQAVLAGHPNTTGIPAIDYFISCKLFEPEGSQAHYTEKLIQLSKPPVWVSKYPKPQKLLNRADLGLPEDYYLYAVPMTLQKLHPDFDWAMAEILRRDPQGMVVIFEDLQYPVATEALKRRWQETMPDVLDRVLVRKFYPQSQFLHFCANVDVTLDPFHFGAGTTGYYLFTAGKPCITLPGEFMRGRIMAGYYEMMGVTDLIARDREHYVELALRAAHDEEFHNSVGKRIAQNCGMVFEDTGAAAELKRVLVDLTNKTCKMDKIPSIASDMG